MIGSTWGQVFRLTTFGESHGIGLGGIVDGCPTGLELENILICAAQGLLTQQKPIKFWLQLNAKSRMLFAFCQVYIMEKLPALL